VLSYQLTPRHRANQSTVEATNNIHTNCRTDTKGILGVGKRQQHVRIDTGAGVQPPHPARPKPTPAGAALSHTRTHRSQHAWTTLGLGADNCALSRPSMLAHTRHGSDVVRRNLTDGSKSLRQLEGRVSGRAVRQPVLHGRHEVETRMRKQYLIGTRRGGKKCPVGSDSHQHTRAHAHATNVP